MLQKISNNKILIFILTLLVILRSGHALNTVIVAPYLYACLAIIFFIPVLMFVLSKNWEIYGVAFLLFIVMVSFQILISLGGNFTDYLDQLFVIIIAFGIVITYEFEKVVELFLKIMTFITAISLIGYVLVNSGLLTLQTTTSLNGVEYGMGYVFNYIKNVPERNCGMFWEPGVFASFLTISIVFELIFKKRRRSILRIILFSLGIITANSSAGFILLYLCFMLGLFSAKGKNANFSNIFPGLIILILGAVVLLNIDYIILNTSLSENEFFIKLLSSNIEESSRAKAITHNLETFIRNPFGAGIGYTRDNMKHVADTSTFTYVMAVYGFLGVSYAVFWVYGILKYKGVNIFCKIILLIIFISILNKEPHLSLIFSWCILFFLLKGGYKEENDNIKRLTKNKGQ